MNTRYPTLSRKQIHHHNQLLGVNYCWQHQAPDGLLWQMQLKTALPDCQVSHYLTLRVDGSKMLFGFDQALLALCCQGVPAASRLPEELQLAFLNDTLKPILSRLFSPASVSIEKQAYAELEPGATWVDFPLLLSTDAGQGLGVVKLAQTQAQSYLQAWQGAPAKSGLDDLPFWLRVICAQTQLSVTDLTRVEVDDVLFFDQVYQPQTGLKIQIDGAGNSLASYHKKQLKFSQPLEYNMPNDLQAGDNSFTEESSYSDYSLSLTQEEGTAEQESPADHISATEDMMPPEEANQGASPGSDSGVAHSDDNALDHINITLNFELAKAPITLAELKRLGPGYSFDLGLDLKAPVAIMVQGKCLGRCELVEIDQRLGARVIEWQGNGVAK
ncbi:type III secretion system cytoplasmic ring protein SctQ [Thalassomonas actiniarum]|uniref:Type III secretion system cytoplasmic ring protein SctQ n=1 Tax=Thalassomonas actiniarum TaxID=485447 RepID=A0AAE9YW16_9GAMM|nr:type III secretion system cytoplasmic ring protein SctQ [Thalassomonas actiniarum]WDE02230.1 type III secretion system cytoplasmic ring protein SctQ [Thalassomonas actiniarum]